MNWGVGGSEPAPPALLHPDRLSRHSCAPLASFLRPTVIPAPLSVIPAQAGIRLYPHPAHPFPNSSLPPFRGEVRWGVGGSEPAPPALLHPDRLSRHSCAPLASFLRPTVIPAPPSVIPAQAGIQAISSACAGHDAATAR